MSSCPWNLLALSCVPSPRNTWLDRMVKFPAEGSVMSPQPKRLDTVQQNLVYALNEWPIYYIISLVAKMYRSRILETKVGMTPLLEEVFSSIITSWNQWLRGSNAQRRNPTHTPREHVGILMFQRLTLPFSHLLLLMLLNEQADNGLLYRPGWSIVITKGKLGCYYTMEARKTMSITQSLHLRRCTGQ